MKPNTKEYWINKLQAEMAMGNGCLMAEPIDQMILIYKVRNPKIAEAIQDALFDLTIADKKVSSTVINGTEFYIN